MAFNLQKFYRLDVGLGDEAVNRVWNYKSEDDNAAAVAASGYFDDVDELLEENDLIYAVSTDDRELLYVSGLDPVTTVDLVTSSSVTIPDGSITNAKLASDAVSGDKVADLGIEAGKYALASIGTADIGTAAVTTAHLGLLAVTGPILADGSVQGSKVADLGITAGKYAAASIATADIGLAQITGALISNSAIGSSKIANGSLKQIDMDPELGYGALKHSAAATAATSTAFTVTGTLTTDTALATMSAGFSQPITGTVCTADTVTVHYAAAALVTDTVDIIVMRNNT